MEKPDNLAALCTRIVRFCRTIALTCGLWLLPLAAWAHDDDEAPTPLDPHAAAVQRWTFGAVATVVVLTVGWYWLRRWQITRAGQTVTTPNRKQDE